MTNFTIIHDQKNCIGCTACELAAPENWIMEEVDVGLKSKPKKTKIDQNEFKINLEAAEVCPVNVIHIQNKQGKKII
ncbi:MAG TPA: ferredoxin [Candidatus Nanoarchaeia archaeon]|nr:ferredoxin [Candidatus Nanoarchaeia archaeon]